MTRSGMLKRIGPFVLMFLCSTAMFAVEINVDDQQKSVSQSFDDDYLFLGSTLGFSGSADSLFFLGRSLVMSGENRGNLLAAAETLSVDGQVADDGFLAARTISVTGDLGGTTFAAAETISLLPSSRVNGTVFIGASNAELAGTVAGDLYVGAGSLVISGTVTGDVYAGAKEITILDSALIEGDFVYDSEQELTEAERARIRGAIRFEDFDEDKAWDKPAWAGPRPWLIALYFSLTILVFAVLFYLFPGTRDQDIERNGRRFWITVAWGLIPFFTFPLLIGAVFLAGIVFGLTIPIGIALVGSLGILGYILYALALPQIGSYISRLFGWSVHTRDKGAVLLTTLIGFVPVLVLGLIPFLNFVAFIVVLSLGWGIALEKAFRARLGSTGE